MNRHYDRLRWELPALTKRTLPSLTGKVAVITGANRGLGLEISRKFVQSGASIVMCARNVDMLAKAREEVAVDQSSGQTVEAIAADVSDRRSVGRVVATTLDRFGKVDILVNNAGIYGPMGPLEDIDWEQWVRTIEINLFGSVLMSRAVIGPMKRRRRGKIIQLSGGGATNPMPNISAYAVSKAGVVRFAETLAQEVREFNIDVNAIAPGPLNTRMLDEVLNAGSEKVGQAFFDRSVAQKESGGSGLEQGANLAVFLASDASDGITGKLISAVWDNWPDWPDHISELRSTDAYTVRRIVGRDRGLVQCDK